MESQRVEKCQIAPPKKTNIPHRKHTAILGTLAALQCEHDDDKKENTDAHDQSCRVQWRDQELTSKSSVLLDIIISYDLEEIRESKREVGEKIETKDRDGFLVSIDDS